MSTNPQGRAWVHVRADALRRNYRRIVEAVGPETGMLPMVKADAYGLGVHGVVAALDPLEPWGYGVAAVQEGVDLRREGVERPILVCSPTPPQEVEDALEAGLDLSVSSLVALDHVGRAARRTGRTPRLHIEVDTGMGRSGFAWRDADTWIPEVRASSDGVDWIGCYTHLHSADEDDSAAAEATVVDQWVRFSGIIERVDAEVASPMVHVLNSAGVFRKPSLGNAIVRPGIYLYGGRIGEGQSEPEEVVSVHARVVHVRDAPAGTTVGYGSTYTASEDERWATLSIGYGDGLPRALGNRGYALVGGARVPIVGRISMDVTVVDISGVPAVQEGDEATLIGTQGAEAISLDEVAGLADTISYEILTGLTRRLPRVWSDG
jgi:alanine racemase